MKTQTIVWALGAVTMCLASTAMAGVLFTEDFEGRAIGALDKNYAGPNAAPNGSGNPWFGPAPPNGQVVAVDSGITPHGGSQMLRGAFVAGADFDENWVNLAYRFNSGAPYAGNIMLDWYFYDVLGSGGSTMRDYVAIGYYNTCPLDTDHPANGSLNTGVTQIQRLSLGASSNLGTGYSSLVYQARVVGLTGYTAGWFNLPTVRSIGWHRGRIIVGPALADLSNQVSFFIDDMVTPTFVSNSSTKWGYNVIELNTKQGIQTGYLDDVSFGTAPQISGLIELGDFVGDKTKVTATFEIQQGGTTVQTIPGVPIDSTGAYKFATSVTGQCDIVAKASHWLSKRWADQTISDAGISELVFPLVNGDVDGDNTVSVFDYTALSDAFDTVPGDTAWNPNADLDGDDSVNVFDYSILSANFDMSGE